MEKNRTIYSAIPAIFLALASCAQDGPGGGGTGGVGNRIFFRSYLPGITGTRAEVISDENLTECRVTCFNPNDTSLINPETGEMTPYFSDCRFVKESDGRFSFQGADDCNWPETNDRLHFFAYSPSAGEMKNEIDGQKFNLADYSRIFETATVFDYYLENFKVASEISQQVDFIATYSSGTRQENGTTGIELDFGHQLARVELSAWSASDIYDIEIAGVRIGNPLTEGDFSFSPLISTEQKAGSWTNTSQSAVEHIFTEGESIVSLSKRKESHFSENKAASIMGSAGPAMIIPMTEKIEGWEGKNDPEIDSESYSTDRLYFSVLISVRNMEDEAIYPYDSEGSLFPSVYLSIGKNGRIIRRVFKIDGEYYTTDKKNEESRYTPEETEEIHAFGWAAMPVAAKWEAGKVYTYKLNYTSGLGWHDPSYPQPGEPIINGRVIIDVDVADWVTGKEQGVTVPRK